MSETDTDSEAEAATEIDDDIGEDLSADWGAALQEQVEGEGGTFDEDVAAQWASMMDEPDEDEGSRGATERVLNQEEIDGLLGFDPNDLAETDLRGIESIVNSALVSYERLPMLEIVFDRLVRLMTTSLRTFTSDNVEVSLDNISSIRFEDYLNSIPLPAILSVFKAVEWDNFGLLTVDSNLIYSIVDVLLGGRRGVNSMRVEGRPYTTIETMLVERMIQVILSDARIAFEPIGSVNFKIDRLETNPRFAAISRPQNAAILVKLRIDMEDRGGHIELMLPYATLEPIRHLLMQGFMGEKFGRDGIWEDHLASEIWRSEIEIEAVLDEFTMPLGEAMNFEIGQTIMLNVHEKSNIVLRCGDVELLTGKMGRKADHIAVALNSSLAGRKTEFTLGDATEEGDST
ncbi:MAG: flagellar motor switch protein FliM [Rhizobiales bacterium]|nr:flagellar motor switch protein FliM [Hyphomicrobiales bacterium]NRB13824.1 flagellar motor switch protein FliM [Hyphomicrobiales bacterium]